MAGLDNMTGTMGFETHTQCVYVASCDHSYAEIVGRWREEGRGEWREEGYMVCNVSGVSIKCGSAKVLWGLASSLLPPPKKGSMLQ